MRVSLTLKANNAASSSEWSACLRKTARWVSGCTHRGGLTVTSYFLETNWSSILKSHLRARVFFASAFAVWAESVFFWNDKKLEIRSCIVSFLVNKLSFIYANYAFFSVGKQSDYTVPGIDNSDCFKIWQYFNKNACNGRSSHTRLSMFGKNRKSRMQVSFSDHSLHGSAELL